jgi:hypothetical protein
MNWCRMVKLGNYHLLTKRNTFTDVTEILGGQTGRPYIIQKSPPNQTPLVSTSLLSCLNLLSAALQHNAMNME